MLNDFVEWLDKHYNKEELLGWIQDLRLGYADVLDELLEKYEEQEGKLSEDHSSIYSAFIDFLTLI